MKKSELKRILKPLIKECVKEAILEEGILSGIITEVVRGVGTPQQIKADSPSADSFNTRLERNAFNKQQSTKLAEHKRKLMEAVGAQAYNGINLFEGTTPAPAQTSPSAEMSTLTGVDPGDAGVDISNLFGSVGKNWGAHMNSVKE